MNGYRTIRKVKTYVLESSIDLFCPMLRLARLREFEDGEILEAGELFSVQVGHY